MSSAKEPLYCLCGQPYDPERFMIQCDVCKDWFHGSVDDATASNEQVTSFSKASFMLIVTRRGPSLLSEACLVSSNFSKTFSSKQNSKQTKQNKAPSKTLAPKMATASEIERMARNLFKWRAVTHQPVRLAPKDIEFSIISYNILAQENLVTHPELYQRVQPEYLEWNYRREGLLKQLLAQKCDIMCLQEVQADHLEDYLGPRLQEAGYEYVFKCKTTNKLEGCAIFWKKQIFGVLKYSPVEMLVPDCKILNRDNVGLIVILKPHANHHSRLCVATTHLLYNPKRGEVKLAQLRYLMAHIEKLAYLGVSKNTDKPMYVPIMLCGDLNATPGCPLYEFVTNGYVELEGLQHGAISGSNRGGYIQPEELHVGNLLPNTVFEDVQMSRFGKQSLSSLQSAYEQMKLYHTFGNFCSSYTHMEKNMSEITTYAETAQTVDYIFYQKSKLLKLVARYDLTTARTIDSLGGIPNAVLCSDHLMLASRFHLKELPTSVLKC